MMIKNIKFFLFIKIAILVFVAWLILLTPIKTPFSIYDEGLAVFNATRIMNGDIPYRDFWAIYPPGQFYTLAILFKTFGASLLVSRLYDTFVRLVIVISVWLIAKKITSRLLAYLAFITTTLLLTFANFYAYAVFPALALGLLSILSLFKYIDTDQHYWLFLAGTLIGLTIFFRWDIGLYVGISIFATILLFGLFRIPQESKPSTKMLFGPSELAILSGASLIIVLTGFGYVGSASGFGNLWDQVVIFPSTIFREVRWLPYPALLPTKSELLNWVRFYFPLFVYGIAFSYYTWAILKKHIVQNTQYFGSIAVFILGVLLFTQALSRYGYSHVLPTSLATILVTFSLLSQAVFKSTNLIFRLARVILLTILISVYTVLPALMLLYALKHFSPLECYSKIERASCVHLEKDQERAIEYIRAHTREGETIFVGNQRHDLILFNDVGFYFLSARQSSSKYSELHPGVATTLSVQQKIVHDIELKNVNWIVLVLVPESTEPNESANSSGISYLDDYIQSKYSLVEKFGNYQILQRIPR